MEILGGRRKIKIEEEQGNWRKVLSKLFRQWRLNSEPCLRATWQRGIAFFTEGKWRRVDEKAGKCQLISWHDAPSRWTLFLKAFGHIWPENFPVISCSLVLHNYFFFLDACMKRDFAHHWQQEYGLFGIVAKALVKQAAPSMSTAIHWFDFCLFPFSQLPDFFFFLFRCPSSTNHQLNRAISPCKNWAPTLKFHILWRKKNCVWCQAKSCSLHELMSSLSRACSKYLFIGAEIPAVFSCMNSAFFSQFRTFYVLSFLGQKSRIKHACGVSDVLTSEPATAWCTICAIMGHCGFYVTFFLTKAVSRGLVKWTPWAVSQPSKLQTMLSLFYLFFLWFLNFLLQL